MGFWSNGFSFQLEASYCHHLGGGMNDQRPLSLPFSLCICFSYKKNNKRYGWLSEAGTAYVWILEFCFKKGEKITFLADCIWCNYLARVSDTGHLIPFEINYIALAECDLKKVFLKANNKNIQILNINVLSHFGKANVINFQLRASCQPQLPLQRLAVFKQVWQKDLKIDIRIPKPWGILEGSSMAWRKTRVIIPELTSPRQCPQATVHYHYPFCASLCVVTCSSLPG